MNPRYWAAVALWQAVWWSGWFFGGFLGGVMDADDEGPAFLGGVLGFFAGIFLASLIFKIDAPEAQADSRNAGRALQGE